MNRRGYLASVCGGAITAFSGCSAVDKLSGSLNSSHEVGDTQSFEGVEFTPTQYLLTNEMTRNYDMHSENVDASSGATYILTHVSVVHGGDSEQTFPQMQGRTDIRLFYNGERVRSGMLDNVSQSYTVGDKELVNYGTALFAEGATTGVYPGTKVDGWLAHEVASNFDVQNLKLHVIWNNQVFIADEDEETHKWTYTEDTEISIEDTEGEPTTVNM